MGKQFQWNKQTFARVPCAVRIGGRRRDISSDVKLYLQQMSRSPSSGCHSYITFCTFPVLIICRSPDKHLSWRRKSCNSVLCGVYLHLIPVCVLNKSRDRARSHEYMHLIKLHKYKYKITQIHKYMHLIPVCVVNKARYRERSHTGCMIQSTQNQSRHNYYNTYL